jgi:hypothetical protein
MAQCKFEFWRRFTVRDVGAGVYCKCSLQDCIEDVTISLRIVVENSSWLYFFSRKYTPSNGFYTLLPTNPINSLKMFSSPELLSIASLLAYVPTAIAGYSSSSQSNVAIYWGKSTHLQILRRRQISDHFH